MTLTAGLAVDINLCGMSGGSDDKDNSFPLGGWRNVDGLAIAAYLLIDAFVEIIKRRLRTGMRQIDRSNAFTAALSKGRRKLIITKRAKEKSRPIFFIGQLGVAMAVYIFADRNRLPFTAKRQSRSASSPA